MNGCRNDPAAVLLHDGMLQSPDGRSEPLADAVGRINVGVVKIYGESIPKGLPVDLVTKLYGGQMALSCGT